MNAINGTPHIPEPMHATYPDGGTQVHEWGIEAPGYEITAHPDGLFRVWRIAHQIGEWAYYPIRVVGMSDTEIEQALVLAVQMLELPTNRKARRARSAVH